MDSKITWPYQIEDHYCRITWVYNKLLGLAIIGIHCVDITDQYTNELMEHF